MPFSHAQKPRRPARTPASKTSWEGVSDWYADYLARPGTVQADIVFPGVNRLLACKPDTYHLDVACGEGSFAHHLLKKTRLHITGVDASPSLIHTAKRRNLPRTTFVTGDATRLPLSAPDKLFDSASCILAIQNIEAMLDVFLGVGQLVKQDAPFVLVLNHPCFRQPRQSGWGWDETRKLQYRRVDRYLSSYEMPIVAHPGSAPQIKTFSYHRPLEAYISSLAQAGFMIDALEEWTSNKVSTSGPRAKAENIAREEIPLFLAIRARKK